MIIKPKIISSGESEGTGSIEVRFLYYEVENNDIESRIVTRRCEVGGSVTPPNIPTTLLATQKSCALTFNGWNYTQAQLTNIQHDLDVGATYVTADGKTHAFVIVNDGVGYGLSVNLTKDDESELTISWGDGSDNYTTTLSGQVTSTHTYATAGMYEITICISSGTGTWRVGVGADGAPFIGNYPNFSFLNNLFLGNDCGGSTVHCFEMIKTLKNITLNPDFTVNTNSLFEYCYSLKNLVVPIGTLTEIKDNCFYLCTSLNYVSFPVGCAVLNGDNNFYACESLTKISIDAGCGLIPTSCFRETGSLESFTIPNDVIAILGSGFDDSHVLEKINIPSSVEVIYSYAFRSCFSLKVITLNRFTAPSTITELSNTNALTNLNAQCRIYVPVGSLDVYKNETNWSNYATKMYEDTPENRDLFGD